ncbi:nitrogen fixation protein NifZ [Paramagnetospirillum marisnigri]|uniref:Nitrogen fixation protein NifZ n=1 Tax=Paramagnetospirillum marisnigri TaxID=1285242 RepID=A0A178M7M3_9PROT|nr:nitrogen fixation protein NifZ [Paramagnetospirillum marisnigri]OAN44781.1 nitrogen fixation protein NifZ [Paramagnetospirillum marisnigri]
MSDAAEEVFELWEPPTFERGDQVVSLRDVRNDGTYPGAKMGEVLIRKGEVGYVHNVGTYLNRFYIYAVEFVDAERLVGMRAHELEGMPS